jgi:hypothetical protein
MAQYGLRGLCSTMVVERGRVLRRDHVWPNLILNQGLDAIASNVIGDCFRFCAIGTGTAPTEIGSGTNTAYVAADGTLKINDPGFLAGDATDTGRVFKFLMSGAIFTVLAPIDNSRCTVSPPTANLPENFLLYNANQTGLENESRRSENYLTGAPNCQTVTSGSVTTMTRTYDFDPETAPVTYTEVGFAPTGTVGPNLFSRIKLDSPVPLKVGQQFRVQYSLQATASPTTPSLYAASPVVGWPSGTGSLQHILVPMNFVHTDGHVTYGQNGIDSLYYGSAGEPAIQFSNTIAISTVNAPHPSYGSRVAQNEVSVAASLSDYQPGSYTRDKFGIFPVGQANGTVWMSYYAAVNFGDGQATIGPRFLFDTAQTKLNTHTLSLGFRLRWGRIL